MRRAFACRRNQRFAGIALRFESAIVLRIGFRRLQQSSQHTFTRDRKVTGIVLA